MKVLWLSTHPCQPTGYAKVGASLVPELARAKAEWSIYWFAFQKPTVGGVRSIEAPPNLTILDVPSEDHNGFGYNTVASVVISTWPDVCVIFNDVLHINQFARLIRSVAPPWCRVVGYLDVVYHGINSRLVRELNLLNGIITMSDSWKQTLGCQDYHGQVSVVEHAIDESSIDEEGSLPQGLDPRVPVWAVCVGRNSARKRHDIVISALTKLLASGNNTFGVAIVTELSHGDFDLLEVFYQAAKANGIKDPNSFSHHLQLIEAGGLTDAEIRAVMRKGHFGISVSDGEGWGLAPVEGLAVGRPQIVSEHTICPQIANCPFVCPVRPAVYVQIPDAIGGRAGIVSAETLSGKMLAVAAQLLKPAEILAWMREAHARNGGWTKKARDLAASLLTITQHGVD